MEHPPNPETRTENLRKVEHLREYLARGYLLHGGKSRVDLLEPRQSTDSDPDRVAGKAHAIYAEAHDVRIPIIMALFDRKDHSVHSWSSGYSAHGPDSTMTLSGKNYAFTRGFVHVLPADTFETEGDEHDNELISRTPVEPIAIIEVDASILDILDNIEYEAEG